MSDVGDEAASVLCNVTNNHFHTCGNEGCNRSSQSSCVNKHGKVMFNLDGQVLEIRRIPSRDLDLLIRWQRDNRLHVEAVSVDAGASSAKYFAKL